MCAQRFVSLQLLDVEIPAQVRESVHRTAVSI
jgi:hypothetical protein